MKQQRSTQMKHKRPRRARFSRSTSVGNGRSNRMDDSDSSSSELGTEDIWGCSENNPSVSSYREVRTESETVETSFEINIAKCGNIMCPNTLHGPMTVNYQGPIFLSPDASLDTIIGFLANHINMPEDKLKNAFARSEGFTHSRRAESSEEQSQRQPQQQRQQQQRPQQPCSHDHHQQQQRRQQSDVLSTTSATSSDFVTAQSQPEDEDGDDEEEEVVADGVQQQQQHEEQQQQPGGAGDVDVEAAAVPVNDGSGNNNSSFPTLVDISTDADGNMRIRVKMRKTVRHKVVKVAQEDAHVMAKAMILTIICAVFIIVCWVILGDNDDDDS